jgi:hypothetical protein
MQYKNLFLKSERFPTIKLDANIADMKKIAKTYPNNDVPVKQCVKICEFLP